MGDGAERSQYLHEDNSADQLSATAMEDLLEEAEQAEAELLQRLHNLQLKSNSTAARKSDSSAGLEGAAAADVEPQATLPVVAPVDESQEVLLKTLASAEAVERQAASELDADTREETAEAKLMAAEEGMEPEPEPELEPELEPEAELELMRESELEPGPEQSPAPATAHQSSVPLSLQRHPALQFGEPASRSTRRLFSTRILQGSQP